MPPIVTSAEIERPAAEVFAYATDPARFSEWQKGVVDGHMDGPADAPRLPALGARCVTTRRIGGASRPVTSELVHIDPPRTWGVRGIDGPIRATVDVLVEPVTDSRCPADHQRRLHRSRHRQDPGAAHGPPGGTQGNAGQHGSAQTTDRNELVRRNEPTGRASCASAPCPQMPRTEIRPASAAQPR